MSTTTKATKFAIGHHVQLVPPEREWAYIGEIVSQDDDAYCGSHDGGLELTPGVPLCPGPFYGVRWDFGDDGGDPTVYSYAEHELVAAIDIRFELAHQAAVHIANLAPKRAAFEALDGITIVHPGDQRPPTTDAEIRAELLDGNVWISWMDEYVMAIMRALHAGPVQACTFCGTEPISCSWIQNPSLGRGDCCSNCTHAAS